MSVNLSREQAGLAVKTGLDLLGPESDLAIPVKSNDGVYFLKALLTGIATGHIALSSAMQEASPPQDTPPPDDEE